MTLTAHREFDDQYIACNVLVAAAAQADWRRREIRVRRFVILRQFGAMGLTYIGTEH